MFFTLWAFALDLPVFPCNPGESTSVISGWFSSLSIMSLFGCACWIWPAQFSPPVEAVVFSVLSICRFPRTSVAHQKPSLSLAVFGWWCAPHRGSVVQASSFNPTHRWGLGQPPASNLLTCVLPVQAQSLVQLWSRVRNWLLFNLWLIIDLSPSKFNFSLVINWVSLNPNFSGMLANV